jgi:O-antigen/teichoic acid export membrane protein
VTISQRLSRAFLSNAYGYGATLLIQAASVPILLSAWGARLYGEWLIASAIPSYLAMSDFGLGSALGNEMAIRIAREERDAAIEAFQSVLVALTLSGVVLLAPIPWAVSKLQIRHSIGLDLIGEQEFTKLIALFIIQIWAAQQVSVLMAGFRCAGHYATSTALAQTLRLFEFGALAVSATAGAGVVGSAAAMVVTRGIGTIMMAFLLRRWVSWLPIGASRASGGALLRLLKPGLMFLVFPISMALNLQTPLIVIGATLGSEAVVEFSTVRTISRSIQQLMSVVNSSVWPEMSHAYGSGDSVALRQLLRMAVGASIWIAGLSAIGLSLFGTSLYRIWTHKLVTFDPVVLDILLAVMLCNAAWFTASVLQAATNRHSGLAAAYLVANVMILPVIWVLARPMGLRGVALGLVLCEVIIAIYAVPASFKLANDRMIDAMRSMLDPIALIRFIWPRPTQSR